MLYPQQSIAQRLLDNDPDAIAQVLRWICATLTMPRFWSLREEWPDLIQETLARVVESLRRGRFDAARDLRVYVQGIVRFTALEALGRRGAAHGAGGPVPAWEASISHPEAKIIQRQLARRILDMASVDCRELIRLHYFEAKHYDEIAALQGIPIGTVKSRLFRCLERAHRVLTFGSATRRPRENA